MATLTRDRPLIVFEHGLGAADYYGTEPQHVHDLLCGVAGLATWKLGGWLEGGPPLDRDQFCRAFHAGTFYFLAAPDRPR